MKANVRRLVMLLLMVVLGVSLAQSSVQVDPSTIASDVQSQMTTVISAGVGLLGFGIVASVGWRYAKRFLRG